MTGSICPYIIQKMDFTIGSAEELAISDVWLCHQHLDSLTTLARELILAVNITSSEYDENGWTRMNGTQSGYEKVCPARVLTSKVKLSD